MYKRGVSVWIGYLMYLLFALSVLSIVLYTVNNYIERNRVQITLQSLEDTILMIDNQLSKINKCFVCYKKIEISLPPETKLSLKDGEIYGTFISNVLYNYSSPYLMVNISRKGSFFVYDLYLKSQVKFRGNVTIYQKGCIYINKSIEGLSVSSC